ncbi:MAG TPA: hypothetical protein VFB80_14665 [Pirellulaceae bacterium]|nr:hypothetical protein [Pirellulaceae bacterium]
MRCELVLAVVLCAGFVAPALAEDKPVRKAGEGKGDQAALQQKLLQQFDANKDGVLSDQEKLAANEFLRRSGAVAGVAPGGFPGADQFAKQFDKDGDGKLNDQEKLMAQAAWQRMRARSSGPTYGPGYAGPYGFAQANANAGGVAAANAAAAGGGAGGEGKAKVSALVKRFDKDGDGKLNDEEKAAAQAELKKDKKSKADKPMDEKPAEEKPAEKPAAEKP